MRLRFDRAAALAAAAWMASALGANAAAAPPLSGFWKMEPAPKALKPALKPKAAAAVKKIAREGDTETDANRWCVIQGMPHVMDSAGPLDIIQGATEVVILTEDKGAARHIYTDGRKHPSEDVFDHTIVGNSIGRWQGGALHVDTTGFTKGLGPFGAPRTETTHLVETFKVTGDKLSVTSTWTDPAVYAKPFTYTLTYDRLPADYTPSEVYCDPREHGLYLPGELR